MQDSFFKNNSFKLIERVCFNLSNKLLNNKIDMSGQEAGKENNIIKVYDFSAWKLRPDSEKTPIYSLSSQEKKLEEFKKQHPAPFGICITLANEVQIAAKYAAFLYIPGEFCRQSDVLEAAAQAKIPLVVEKGLFLSPNDIARLCQKIQGSDYCLVECGSSNGYSDSFLDPRSLALLKKNSNYFGVSLSDLLAPEGMPYSHRPQWLNNPEFVEAFIKTSKAFEASFFVIKSDGHGKLNAEHVLNLVNNL